MSQLESDANSAISNLIANYPSMTVLDALTEAHYLTAAYDLVSFASFSSVIDMVLDLATSGSPVSQEILEATFRVYTNLSKMRLSSESEHRTVTNRISDTTLQIIEANLVSNPLVSTDSIDIRVE